MSAFSAAAHKMTDLELLKMAAKAAGIEYSYSHGCGGALELMKPRGFQIYWNPLADDSDALRLAVRLGMDVCFGTNYVIVRGSVQAPTENNTDDPCAATRRAIVRAAAEIGRSMK